jgi:hypothetical protein
MTSFLVCKIKPGSEVSGKAGEAHTRSTRSRQQRGPTPCPFITVSNNYALAGLHQDVVDGTWATDPDHLELAVELTRDIADYVNDPVLGSAIGGGQALRLLCDVFIDHSPTKSPDRVRLRAAADWATTEGRAQTFLREP